MDDEERQFFKDQIDNLQEEIKLMRESKQQLKTTFTQKVDIIMEYYCCNFELKKTIKKELKKLKELNIY